MKRIFSVLFALVVVSALTFLATTTSKHGVRAVYAQSSGCTVATLTGNYAHTNAGFLARGTKGAEVPLAIVGVDAFDGAGNISFSGTASFNGSIVTPFTASGTYTVNSDCTGSIAFPDLTANMVIIGGGQRFLAWLRAPAPLLPSTTRSNRRA